MSYYDPLLAELEQLDQPNYLTQSGQAMSMRGAPIRVGGGFWGNLAQQIVPGLLGAGMSYLGQQQNRGEQDALLAAAKLEDPQAIAASLEAGGYKDTAAKVLFAAQAQKAAEAQKIADLKNNFEYGTKAAYLLAQPERDRDEAYRQAQLGISRGSQSLQQRQMDIQEQRLANQELIAKQTADLKGAVETGKIGRDGLLEMNKLAETASQDKVVTMAQDAKNRAYEIASLIKIPDPTERALASTKVAVAFSKLPGEAYMSDDAKRTADAMGFGDKWSLFTQKMSAGGAIPDDLLIPAYNVMKQVAVDTQDRKNAHIIQTYYPRMQSILDGFQSPYEPGKVLVSRAPMAALNTIDKFEQINSLPGTPTAVPAPGAQPAVRSNGGIVSGLARSIYNAIGGG
jgi:hypothetical protein